jgi:hypothetical protein
MSDSSNSGCLGSFVHVKRLGWIGCLVTEGQPTEQRKQTTKCTFLELKGFFFNNKNKEEKSFNPMISLTTEVTMLQRQPPTTAPYSLYSARTKVIVHYQT